MLDQISETGQIFLCLVSLTAQQLLLFVTVAMSTLYLSTAKGRSRKAEGNFTHKMTIVTVVTFQTWTLCSFLRVQRTCLLKKKKKKRERERWDSWFLKK
jgi:hypothetical protein